MPETNNISDIVVNAAMNRGRGFTGVNSYTRDLRQFDIAAFLQKQAADNPSRTVRWLDVCCGEGRALTEAAQIWSRTTWGKRLEIIGLDLWDNLPPSQKLPDGPMLSFAAGDVANWIPDAPLDLITCIHGLHYLPDKLGFLERAYSWLRAEGGLFLGHLDKANMLDERNERPNLWSAVLRRARQQRIDIQLTRHLLRMNRTPGSPNTFTFGASFAGRTVSPKPNFSGMTVVDSWYRLDEST